MSLLTHKHLYMNVDTLTTIIAQCTPQGSGAIALLRISGPRSFNIADTISQLANKSTISSCQSHTIHFGRIADHLGVVIDQVMFLVMRGPKTFTGEDVIEITCHNNQFIIEQIIEVALKAGARLARPGEFSQQAFVNKKIDLIQAEAIHDLIHASSEVALKKSLAQLEGTLSRFIYQLEEELIRALAWCEASFEFLDDEGDFAEQIRNHLIKQKSLISQAVKHFDKQKHIREGIRIALIGSVNAGKSSLFNALIGHKRAIVSPLAGTTRDSIEATLHKNGVFLTMIDTAGLRIASDAIEQEGIVRSYLEAQKADIIILVTDSSRLLLPEEYKIYTDLYTLYAPKIISVFTKMDCSITDMFPENHIKVSVHVSRGISELEEQIKITINSIFHQNNSQFLLNKRQHSALISLDLQLDHLLTLLSHNTVQYELVSLHLREALENLCQLTGKSINEAGMDMVFKEFCVGK